MILRHDSDPDRGQGSLAGSFFGWAEGSLFFRGLIGIMCFLTVVYQEENWRGKRAWQVCKRELESKGKRLDWSAFVPAAVPDDLNAFKAPMMSQWFCGRGQGGLYAQMNNEALFASARQGLPPLADVTVLPLTENAPRSDADLELEFRAPVLALSSARAPGALAAQDGVIPLIVMDDVPLLDAIRNLARQSSLNYMVDPQVSYGWSGPKREDRSQPVVSLRFENVTAFQLLIQLLHDHNLQWVEDPKSRIARVTWRNGAGPNVYVVAAAQEQIRRVVADSAIPSAGSPSFRMLKGASGGLTLFADIRRNAEGATTERSTKLKTARIVVRADKMPSSREVQEFLQGGNATGILATHRLWVHPLGTNSFRGYATPPAFCRATDYLACTDQFEGDFDLMREALKRPFARMDGDYSRPYAAPTPNFLTLHTVTQVLTQRAQAHLLLNHPEAALRDLALVQDLCGLLDNKPTGRPNTLVVTMVGVALTGLYVNSIADGFRLGAWQEPQLCALQELLSGVHLAPRVAEAIAAERAGSCLTLETASASEFAGLFSNPTPGASPLDMLKDPIYDFLIFAPRGWIYRNMVTVATLHEPMLDSFDPTTGCVRPGVFDRICHKPQGILGSAAPRFFLAQMLVPDTKRAWQAVAKNDTLGSQGFIACALERYRLAHGMYPESLDALVPDFARSLPRDIISGRLPHYHRTEDGKFLLYCVGWNQTDDGGTVVGQNGGATEYASGDWVWPQFPN